MLENHRQFGAQALQLLRIGRFQGTVLVRYQLHGLAVERNAALVGLLQQVDTAQQGAFTGTARANDAGYIASVGGQGNAAQDFVVAVALVQIFNE